MAIPNLTLITDVQIVLPHAITRRGTVIIEGNRIGDIVDTIPGSLLLNQENVQVISGEGQVLTPGLIDLQVNGAYGVDFNVGGIQAIHQTLRQLPEHGITGLLMTAITATQADMLKTINTLEEVIHHKYPKQTRPLGIHLEGPFLSAKYRGTHPLGPIDAAKVEDVLNLISPNVKQMTLAPERERALELIQALVRKGIRVSAGHTNADTDTFLTAMANGLQSVTHLFNAMRPFHHREPGVAGVALADPKPYVQLIADGAHLHPYTLEAIIRAKPFEKMILVSDMMQLAGLPQHSSVRFAGQAVTSKAGRAVNAEGNLAGSCAFLDQCVRNLVRWDLSRFAEAVLMASTHAAEYLGEGHHLGKIQRGYLADLVLWQEGTLDINATWINGDLVYQRPGTLHHPEANRSEMTTYSNQQTSNPEQLSAVSN